jgi:putative transcriptional regulator
MTFAHVARRRVYPLRMPESDDITRTPRKGSLLVAAPSLLDPNFMHAVVFVCAHDEDGTLGLVLNRPTRLTVEDLKSDVTLLIDRDDPLWQGGPVGTEELHVLHRTGAEVAGALSVKDGVFLDGDPEILARALQRRDAAEPPLVRFLLGYAGWGAAQLAAEVAEGSWIVCPGSSRDVFDPRPDTLWRRVLKAQGGKIAGLADLPPDPSWN